MTRGIDLSHNNGTVDWNGVATIFQGNIGDDGRASGMPDRSALKGPKVKNSGQVDFAIIRAGFGWDNDKQVDRQFWANVEGCQQVGIPYGLYHYSYATTVEEARLGARWLLKVIQGLKPECPVFWDFERPEQIGGAGCKGLPLSTQIDMVDAWMEVMESAGYFAGLYSTASALRRLQQAYPDRLGRYLLWVAHVNVDKPLISGGIWQYSWKGRVPGISGPVDLNNAYQDFPAIIRKAGLNGWAKQQEPIPAPTDSISLADLCALLQAEGWPKCATETLTWAAGRMRNRYGVQQVRW